MSSTPESSLLSAELHFLIAKFLADGPCSRAAAVLVEEIEKNDILPKSLNWLGETVPQDFNTLSSKLSHIGPGYLCALLEKLILTNPGLKESREALGLPQSLLSSQTTGIVLRNAGIKASHSPAQGHTRFHGKSFGSSAALNTPKWLQTRESFGTGISRNYIQPSFYSRLRLGARSLGHLSAVYCVLFDQTGNYIFTGADDHLVKIWSVNDGRLLATLRGNSAEITDLAVNSENTLLASSSCDRYIRIWCLATTAPLAILTAHTSNVTSIFFCPMPRSRSKIRYLASTSNDGSCAFWAYTEEPGKKAVFQPKPTLYQERMRPGHAQMICSSFSPGGVFMAAGSADNNVRVYHMLDPEGPKRVLEVECHTERVDSISWAHRGVRFISGSKDGTALVWRFEYNQWKYTRLPCNKAGPGEPAEGMGEPKIRPLVTMVGWNADDTLVLTAISTYVIKVWNPDNGSLVRVLKDHTDESFVIEPHPTNPRVVCTAGHDGRIIVWDIGLRSDRDIEAGKKIYEHKNILEEGQGTGAVFDAKWAPDGLSLAATDSHGHILILTVTENDKFQKLPRELFFHTDYRPLTTDAITNQVLDEQTQVLPHLMPPPFLVNMDGNPYPPEQQRLVPGRENCNDEQLIPNVAVAPGGQAEVIEGIPGNARSNIDQLIARLAAEQGGAEQNQEDEENRPNDLRGVAFRRTGDVEGVRQSRGNWQTIGLNGVRSRAIVPPVPTNILKQSEQLRYAHGEEEEKHFQEHKLKTPPHNSAGHMDQVSPSDSLTSRQIRSRRLRHLAAQAAERRRAEDEHRLAEEAGVPIPNPPQQEISAPQRLPPRSTARHPRGPGNRRAGGVRYIMRRRDSEPEADPENGHSSGSESSYTTSDASGPSSSESEYSDSDWGGGTALGTGSPRKTNGATATASARKRTTRNQSDARNGVPAGSDDNSDEDFPDPDPRPGPSSQSHKVAKPVTPKARPRRAQQKVMSEDALGGVPEHYRPSEWLTSLTPRKFPYFPQLGDELVFFRQGHQRYIQQVKQAKLYELTKKFMKSLPWNVNPDLEDQVPVRVIGIKFEIYPPVLVNLKLQVMNWETGEPTSQVINNVVYHDVRDVVDFLILRQLYDKSMRHNWNVNDRFRCLIDDYWWLGTIETVKPFNPQYPNSKFLCYGIVWDNDNKETLSPWDIEIIPDAFEVTEGAKDEGVPASEADQRAGLYEVSPRDWPPHGHQEAVCDSISRLLSDVMGLGIAEPFLTPVDLNKYPDYSYQIEYPMDLSTIKARLDSRFYRRLESLKFDINYIAFNAEIFNRPRTDIVKKARIIRDLCNLIASATVDQRRNMDVNAEYHRLSNNFEWDSGDVAKLRGGNRTPSKGVKQEPQPGPSSAMGRSSSRLREKQGGRNRRRGGGGRSSSDSSRKPWAERCKELLNKIWNCRDAHPFREPVDIVEVPDYYQQIDTPMDLQSIKEDLLGGNYQSPLDFSKDVQLIFSNSKQYNTDKHSAIYQMTIRLKAMFDCQIRPIIEDWKQQKRCSSKRSQNMGGKCTSSTPSKSTRTSSRKLSSLESPRKNPLRTAASKNPYVQREDSNQDSTEEDEEPEADEEEYHDRRRKKRRTTGQLTPSARAAIRRAAPARNGNRSSSSPTASRGPQAGPSRAVKRLRILSGDSVDEPTVKSEPVEDPSSPARKTSPRLKAGKIKYTTRSSVGVTVKKEEAGSNEDEDSEVEMPKLKAEDEDWTEHGPSAARKRTNSALVKRVSKRRRMESEESDNMDRGRKTRFQGRRKTNYEEMNDEDLSEEDPSDYENAEDFQESPESPLTLADRVKRHKRIPHTTSTNGHASIPTPRVRRTKEEPVESEEEDSSEDSESEDNQAGPSSRLLAKPAPVKRASLRRAPVQPEPEASEEDYAEEEEEEDEEEELGEEEEEDAEEYRPGRSRAKPKRARRSRRTLSSDDEDEGQRPRRLSTRAPTQREGRSRGGGKMPDYAETSEEEDGHNRKLSVSSRGRVRRHKAYFGE